MPIPFRAAPTEVLPKSRFVNGTCKIHRFPIKRLLRIVPINVFGEQNAISTGGGRTID